jgi:hypothetical protein
MWTMVNASGRAPFEFGMNEPGTVAYPGLLTQQGKVDASGGGEPARVVFWRQDFENGPYRPYSVTSDPARDAGTHRQIGAIVPSPMALIAGAALLLPFLASTLRPRHRHRKAAVVVIAGEESGPEAVNRWTRRWPRVALSYSRLWSFFSW